MLVRVRTERTTTAMVDKCCVAATAGLPITYKLEANVESTVGLLTHGGKM